MSKTKPKPSKIKFDQNWSCRSSTDDIDINVITNIDGNDHQQWISLQLPHLIDTKEQESKHISSNNKQNWWYRKQFQSKNSLENSHERISLLFQSLKDHKIVEDNNDYNITNTVTIWLNGIEIFSDLFQPPELSIDLTEHLKYKNDSDENSGRNTLIVQCKNSTLSLHTYLLLSHGMTHAIEQEDFDARRGEIINKSPLRKNRVLDYLIAFNDDEGRFDMNLMSRVKCPTVSELLIPPSSIKQENTEDTTDGNCNNSPIRNHHTLDYLLRVNNVDTRSNISFDQESKSPTLSTHSNLPDIIVSEDLEERERADNEEFYVPRLAIVMLIVGTRGDVQPFVAFGQRLRSAGHRVRLATHEKFRTYVRQHDLEFYPLALNPEDLMSFVVKNGGLVPSMNSILKGDLKKKRRDIADILESTWFACTENDDETSASFRADVIIANPPSFGHVHCAQKLQIPLHIMFTMPWSPTTVFPHAFCKVDYSKVQRDKMNLLSYGIIDTLTWSGMHDLVNDFRRETLDLPPLNTRQAIRILIDEQVPHTYCWSPSLVPRPFDWPSHINVAGYFFLESDQHHQFKPSDDLVAFLGLDEEEKKNKKLSPPIYIGFGSITGHDSDRLFQVILDALEKTGYRALLSGFDKENDELPETILKIDDVPHDWLFQHVSAVCHHGGAGTVAAGLRAGKPSIIIPFFGDQFFWGNVVAKKGAGPIPLPGKHVTVDELADAFEKVHQSEMRMAAERIRDAIAQEDGCTTALRLFHARLPLSRMRSDLESTFPACYRVEELDLQISRPVAQVLVASGALDQSQFRSYATRDWVSIYDNRLHVPTRGVFKHTRKALSHVFIQTADGMRRATSSTNLVTGIATGVSGAAKGIGKGFGHLSIGVLSLYGELTDVLDRVPSLYDPYSTSDPRERPRVVDFKSGAKAAGFSIEHGWKDGITGFVKKPRTGYHRHGLLGGATGVLVATANGIVKPTVGTLATATWLSRGMYASLMKKKRGNRTKEESIVIEKHSEQSSLSSSPNIDDDDDNDNDVPTNIKFAALVSGYPADVCQQILEEFERVKRYHEEISAIPSNENQKRRHRDRFLRRRRHSDSSL